LKSSREKDQESLALLKILTLSRKSVDEGNYRPAAEVFAAIKGANAVHRNHNIQGADHNAA